MLHAAGTRRKSGFRTTLNLAAFATTFAVLAGSNLPVLRAVAAASVSVETSDHLPVSRFKVPAIALTAGTGTALPSVPTIFSAEPQFAALFETPISFGPAPRAPDKPEPSRSMPFGLFGSLEFRTNATKGIGAWRKALAQLDNEKPLYEFCDVGMLDCPPKYVAWRQLLAGLRGLPTNEQLSRLNRGVNALIGYRSDDDSFRVRDHWASPMEFLQTGGDCEDYTILKYASLLELGYSDRQLRIAVVKDTKRQLDHAVLAVSSQAGPIILDSLTDAPVAHSQIRHYRPIYSVNRESRWVHIATKQITRLSASQGDS